ncbi:MULTISPECIES: GNAT family N-acetyltransferase [Protofrankia]|uniref:GCN5-related N-acetyltransferase n=1 Tax=Candidatus Protofrankia datiscae TaxID=2716812 RepID=F8AYV9_9ACTN|nr:MULTISPECIES: GNAT family N-acetyltransferase [Protofrankia]AEH08626.1 GCN5-related N-acetyltransferase [Candidatus Protofrankia datiscae]
MNIPTLTTGRLVLRPICRDDLDASTAIWADAEFGRYVGTHDRHSMWHNLAANIGAWELEGAGSWSVVERATGVLVGRAGLWYEPEWPGIELVWFIGRPWWGRGYAPEAARASGTWAFANHDVNRLVAIPHRDNQQSIRVAEKLGMTFERYETLHETDSAIYAITRAEWEARTRTGD